MQSKDTDDIIEKTEWGNEQSMEYFLMESQNKHAGKWSVVSNTTKHHKLTSSDFDYHLLGSSLCNKIPHKKWNWWQALWRKQLRESSKNEPVTFPSLTSGGVIPKKLIPSIWICQILVGYQVVKHLIILLLFWLRIQWIIY